MQFGHKNSMQDGRLSASRAGRKGHISSGRHQKSLVALSEWSELQVQCQWMLSCKAPWPEDSSQVEAQLPRAPETSQGAQQRGRAVQYSLGLWYLSPEEKGHEECGGWTHRGLNICFCFPFPKFIPKLHLLPLFFEERQSRAHKPRRRVRGKKECAHPSWQAPGPLQQLEV